eukprot:TRINITY_DN111762_c0_g1_i1.p1 TRINITY_DN111762_c0_g1~~TRINITY_DN111762_c0_g1_i1.p1  ORF type:complete len:764 (-),score=119.84 TRINITY_DN111762_c0_g1_i1:60-2267(-)
MSADGDRKGNGGNGIAVSSPFQELLQQLAAAHEKEVGELKERISSLQKKRFVTIDDPLADQKGHERSEAAPSRPAASRNTVLSGKPLAIEDKNSDGTTGESLQLVGAWTQMPPKFTVSERDEGDMIELNRPSSSNIVDEEVVDISDKAEVKKSDCLIIDPGTSTGKMIWDLCGMMLIGWDMVMIPVSLSFDPQGVPIFIFMGWLTMLFWTCDMFISLNTGVREADGTMILNRCGITKSYLKSWFIVDCIVVVPDWAMTIVEMTGGGTDGQGVARMGRVLRVVRAMRILRLFRLLKLKKMVTIVYDSIDSEHMFIVVGLFQLILVILVMNHYVACLWYIIGAISLSDPGQPSLNWLQHAGQTPVYGMNTWWQYTTSLHWSITQFTPASMDVSAVNTLERVFSISILFISLVSLSSIIGSVSASMTQLRGLKGDTTKQFWMLRRYLRERQVERNLRDRILRYVESQTEDTNKSTPPGKVALLSVLSEPLKRELATAMFEPTLREHPLFGYLSGNMPKILERICENIKTLRYAEDDIVFRNNEEAVQFYVVKSGIFDYTLSGMAHPREPPLKKKEWIGEMALWTMWRHCGDYVARESGELLLVDPKGFSSAMRLHPRSWHFGRTYGAKILKYTNSLGQSRLTDLTFDTDIEQYVEVSDVFDDTGSALVHEAQEEQRAEQAGEVRAEGGNVNGSAAAESLPVRQGDNANGPAPAGSVLQGGNANGPAAAGNLPQGPFVL